jgi:hypothetical protein
MEEIKEPKDAYEGDLVEYEDKIYRVVAIEYYVGHRILKVVTSYPRFKFTRVRKICVV